MKLISGSVEVLAVAAFWSGVFVALIIGSWLPFVLGVAVSAPLAFVRIVLEG
jgi:hypothetical protein